MKNIRLRIKTDGSVHVSADTSVSLKLIEDFIQRKIPWILEKQEEFRLCAPNETELSDGAELSYFGTRLKLRITKAAEEYLICTADSIELGIPNPANVATAETLLLRNIAETGRELFQGLICEYLKKAGWKGDYPSLSIKLLKSKWGHYSIKNHEIMINIAVCGLPAELIRYIAAHETAHLFVRGHKAEFYAFGESLLPGFKALDRQLNRFTPDLWKNLLDS